MNAEAFAAKFIADNILGKEYSVIELLEKLTGALRHVHHAGGEKALDDWNISRVAPINIAFDVVYPDTLTQEQK